MTHSTPVNLATSAETALPSHVTDTLTVSYSSPLNVGSGKN